MKEFDALLEVADQLLSPNGCPWDQKQTFASLQPYVLEEAHEVIEAVDKQDDEKIVEELGDLLYTIIFYAKLAQRENRFSMKEIVYHIKDKLIRRHPHVFGDVKVEDVDQVVRNWEQIKKQEKKNEEERKSVLDGIPPTLPTLVKSQKIIKRMLRSEASFLPEEKEEEPLTEKQAGSALFELILKGERSGIDMESALRKEVSLFEERFRAWEKKPTI